MNLKIVSYFLGWVLLIEAAAMVIPFVLSLVIGENDVWPWFLVSIAISAAAGALMAQKRFRKGSFYAREGYAITALGWIAMSAVGSLPFFLSRRIPNFLDALFEIVSGFTTTGSSILSDVEALGKGLLLWRSFSHWIGGMGVLVLIIALLPMNSAYNMHIMKAESPGPSVSKLVPRVRETAMILYLIYIGMTVVMILTYLISGMGLFDAVCIGFGTAGTGGFTVRNSGMNGYNTVSQALVTVWMILFGVNFNAYYLIVRKKWREAFKFEEILWYFGFIAAGIAIFTAFLARDNGFFFSLHHSAFTMASIITTTGFATVDFNLWHELPKALLLVVMCIGACAGSTGGGLKVSRIALLLKEAKNELHMLIHPNSVKVVKLNKKTVEQSVLRSVNRYLILYLVIFIVSVLLISIDGFDFTTNLSAVAATLNNIGPGLSKIGPVSNFGAYSGFSKAVLIFDMIAGRLELLPMLLLFYPKTWTKHY